LGLVMYLSGYLPTISCIILTSRFEYRPGSMPESAHPPTPSATIKTCWDAKMASSPPFYSFSG
jgi:hypothetical protein